MVQPLTNMTVFVENTKKIIPKPSNSQPNLSYLITTLLAIKDEVSHNYTLASIIDFIHIPKSFDSYVLSFAVFGRLENLAEGPNATTVNIIHEDGVQLATSTLNGTLRPGPLEFTAAFNYVRFEKTGRYHFQVIHNGSEIPGGEKYYFRVMKQQ